MKIDVDQLHLMPLELGRAPIKSESKILEMRPTPIRPIIVTKFNNAQMPLKLGRARMSRIKIYLKDYLYYG